MLATLETDAEEFRRRRAEARRCGTPAWLWPEISQASWAEAARQISRVVTPVFEGKQPSLTSSETQALSLACYTTGLGPLLGWWVETGVLRTDSETAALLGVHLDQARLRKRRVTGLSRQIVRRLTEAGVDTLVLKGGHTAHAYFPHPATRPSSDLDLLVREDQVERAEAVLASRGFDSTSQQLRESNWAPAGQARHPRSLWLVHADDPWSVDLHSSLDLSPSAGGQLARLDDAGPFETRDRWRPDETAYVLRQPLLLLHLAAHASGGLHSLTLLRMVEIILVVRRDLEEGRLSWDEFLETAERIGAAGAAFPALRLSEKLVPGTVPRRVLERCALAAPRRARAIVERLAPATAHRVERASVTEHFMWVTGLGGWTRQLRSDLFPTSGMWPVYQARAYRLLRGRITR